MLFFLFKIPTNCLVPRSNNKFKNGNKSKNIDFLYYWLCILHNCGSVFLVVILHLPCRPNITTLQAKFCLQARVWHLCSDQRFPTGGSNWLTAFLLINLCGLLWDHSFISPTGFPIQAGQWPRSLPPPTSVEFGVPTSTRSSDAGTKLKLKGADQQQVLYFVMLFSSAIKDSLLFAQFCVYLN